MLITRTIPMENGRLHVDVLQKNDGEDAKVVGSFEDDANWMHKIAQEIADGASRIDAKLTP